MKQKLKLLDDGNIIKWVMDSEGYLSPHYWKGSFEDKRLFLFDKTPETLQPFQPSGKELKKISLAKQRDIEIKYKRESFWDWLIRGKQKMKTELLKFIENPGEDIVNRYY